MLINNQDKCVPFFINNLLFDSKYQYKISIYHNENPCLYIIILNYNLQFYKQQ